MGRKLTAVILVTVILINLTGCGAKKETRYEASFLNLFDTVTTIVGYAKDKETFTEYAQMIHDKLKEYNDLYDIYNNYEGINNIKTINDNAGKAPVKVSKEIIDLLIFAKDICKRYNGKMNIALGSVLSVWHQYREAGLNDPNNAKLPPMDVLKEKAQHTDIDNLIIDEKNSTVYLKDPEMSLDVGGIAKGYATELVSVYVEKHGFKNGMISVGGNVRTIGEKLDSKDKNHLWRVGIQNPDLESEKSNLYVLGLNNYSLVTSGVYERYYTVNGKQYHHLIDPDTLMPATSYLSVTIACPSSGMADALTKVIFNLPYEEGLKVIEAHKGMEALWVFPDGSMKYSPGFKKLVLE